MSGHGVCFLAVDQDFEDANEDVLILPACHRMSTCTLHATGPGDQIPSWSLSQPNPETCIAASYYSCQRLAYCTYATQDLTCLGAPVAGTRLGS